MNAGARFRGAALIAAACWLWMSTLCAAPACIERTASPPSADGGIGGTGSRADGGIGGTGIVAGGGIGGTGAVADGGMGGTGIVGTITGFASVCVNGLEVHYDRATAIARNGQPVDVASLALGQVIAIDAAHTSKGLVAQRIDIVNLLEGPVTGVEQERGTVQVLGQTVRVYESTHLGGLNSLAEVQPDMPLRVAGFRAPDGGVYATRIEFAPGLADASAIGMPARLASGETGMDGMLVRTVAALPSAAGELLLRGYWDGRQLVAREAFPDPSLPFVGHAGHVVAEGLILERMGATGMRVGGFSVELSAETHIAGTVDGNLAEGQRIRVAGRLEGGNRVVAQRIEVAPPALPYRPAPVQRQPGGGPTSGCEGCQPADRARMMERMGKPERPQRMERPERIPMPRMDMPAGGMTGMRR